MKVIEGNDMTLYETSDGSVFDSKWKAEEHEARYQYYHGATEGEEPAGRKDDNGKPSVHRGFMNYFPNAITEVTKVSEFGAGKYDWNNCFHVLDAINRYSDAADRHYIERLQGVECDEESGLLHEAHEVWNRLVVLELKLRGIK